METKGLIHVSAPDHPEAGASKPSLGEGSGCYAGGPGPYEGSGTLRGVRDPMRGPGPCGGPDSSGGPEPRLLVLECLSLLGHVAFPDLPRPWNGSGLLSGGQDFGPQGSGCLVVV